MFSAWHVLSTEPLKKLFPGCRFYVGSWSEVPLEGGARRPGLAMGIEVTLACDTSGKIVKVIYHTGNYEVFGDFLNESKATVSGETDVKLLWDAFCDIHQRHWRDQPSVKVDDRTWHLGNSTYDKIHYFYTVKLDADRRVVSARLDTEVVKSSE